MFVKEGRIIGKDSKLNIPAEEVISKDSATSDFSTIFAGTFSFLKLLILEIKENILPGIYLFVSDDQNKYVDLNKFKPCPWFFRILRHPTLLNKKNKNKKNIPEAKVIGSK